MSVFGLADTPTLSLTPTSSSFPFQAKYIYFTGTSSATPTKISLGYINPTDSSESVRASAASNGWFKDINGVWPMSLECEHAEVWFENASIWISAKKTKRGTFVNNERLAPGKARRLQAGDILMLGDHVSPLEGMESTDMRLKPIDAKVGTLGIRANNW